ncbi:MAG: sn-glycerol-3-phosphate ABC transporter ATP-binding protein UgpC [Albidovulum sp.]|nr:sn-glycerol-3-phosphate ABC transporter ATP-binding protein UgpC [Albidovulum sp.]
MAKVELQNIEKVYDGDIKVIHKLNIELPDSEFLVVVGPSGCGKSTALRMIAGLTEVTSGSIIIGGREVNNLAPRDRDVAMIFQNYALYPHMTVAENIGFPLRLARVALPKKDEQVRRVAGTLGLEALLERKPGQLSGGQRQRVAMGRAIVRQPAVFLMDEPLSNLDAKLRVQMRAEITKLQHRLGVTTFYVTHDQIEAMTMADRVAVLRDGRLQQIDPPQEIYERPANLFVASFIGSPTMNLFRATLGNADDGGASLNIGSNTIKIPSDLIASRDGLANHAGREIAVGFRPEDMEDAAFSEHLPAAQPIHIHVDLVESLGAEKLVHFRFDAEPIDAANPDLPIGASQSGSNCRALINRRSNVAEGDNVRIAIDVMRMHFFDLATGSAL